MLPDFWTYDVKAWKEEKKKQPFYYFKSTKQFTYEPTLLSILHCLTVMKYIFHFYSGTVDLQSQELISVKGMTGYTYKDFNRLYYWTQIKNHHTVKTSIK